LKVITFARSPVMPKMTKTSAGRGPAGADLLRAVLRACPFATATSRLPFQREIFLKSSFYRITRFV
jgi:hypothetical protein